MTSCYVSTSSGIPLVGGPATRICMSSGALRADVVSHVELSSSVRDGRVGQLQMPSLSLHLSCSISRRERSIPSPSEGVL